MFCSFFDHLGLWFRLKMVAHLTTCIIGASMSEPHTSLGPRPKTNPSANRFQYRARGRKGLVDIVHIPKDSLPLIQTCWNYQNFTCGQKAVGDKCHGRLVWLAVSDLCNRQRLNTSPSVDAQVSELFKVLDAAQQQRRVSTFQQPVCKACSQKVEKLLKFESSVSVYWARWRLASKR